MTRLGTPTIRAACRPNKVTTPTNPKVARIGFQAHLSEAVDVSSRSGSLYGEGAASSSWSAFRAAGEAGGVSHAGPFGIGLTLLGRDSLQNRRPALLFRPRHYCTSRRSATERSGRSYARSLIIEASSDRLKMRSIIAGSASRKYQARR